MPKLSPEHEIIAAHMAATTAAFQVLILLLERNGTLQRGDYQDTLREYMEKTKDQHPDTVLAMLHDLRRALLD